MVQNVVVTCFLLMRQILHDPIDTLQPLFPRFWYMRLCRISIINCCSDLSLGIGKNIGGKRAVVVLFLLRISLSLSELQVPPQVDTNFQEALERGQSLMRDVFGSKMAKRVQGLGLQAWRFARVVVENSHANAAGPFLHWWPSQTSSCPCSLCRLLFFGFLWSV